MAAYEIMRGQDEYITTTRSTLIKVEKGHKVKDSPASRKDKRAPRSTNTNIPVASDSLLSDICKVFPEARWKALIRDLGLTRSMIIQLDKTYDNQKDKLFNGLRAWRDIEGEQATALELKSKIQHYIPWGHLEE